MENSGIEETMSTAYTEGPPDDKREVLYTRTIRSHAIIVKALMPLLLQDNVESEMDEKDIDLLKGNF